MISEQTGQPLPPKKTIGPWTIAGMLLGCCFIAMFIVALVPQDTNGSSSPQQPKVNGPTLKFPNTYTYWLLQMACPLLPDGEVFRCDYTSQTCMSGFTRGGSSFIGEVVSGDDRRTVLAHMVCTGICWNLDTGEAWQGNMRVPSQDLHADKTPQQLTQLRQSLAQVAAENIEGGRRNDAILAQEMPDAPRRGESEERALYAAQPDFCPRP